MLTRRQFLRGGTALAGVVVSGAELDGVAVGREMGAPKFTGADAVTLTVFLQHVLPLPGATVPDLGFVQARLDALTAAEAALAEAYRRVVGLIQEGAWRRYPHAWFGALTPQEQAEVLARVMTERYPAVETMRRDLVNTWFGVEDRGRAGGKAWNGQNGPVVWYDGY